MFTKKNSHIFDKKIFNREEEVCSIKSSLSRLFNLYVRIKEIYIPNIMLTFQNN